MFILNTEIYDAQTNGVYPQVESMGNNYLWESEQSIERIITNSPLDFKPNFNTFTLDRKTKLTDVISQSYVLALGLLVSKNFLQVINKFEIQSHEIYSAPVNLNGVISNYYWMHFINRTELLINFSKSLFEIVDMNLENSLEITFKSREDYENKCRELSLNLNGHMIPVKLVFSGSQAPLDMFYFRTNEPILYISDNLASELREAGLTGFEIVPSKVCCIYYG